MTQHPPLCYGLAAGFSERGPLLAFFRHGRELLDAQLAPSDPGRLQRLSGGQRFAIGRAPLPGPLTVALLGCLAALALTCLAGFWWPVPGPAGSPMRRSPARIARLRCS
ncbi:MAG: hypothetical protein ACR2N4_11855 [Jatrophihabitans sp.]